MSMATQPLLTGNPSPDTMDKQAVKDLARIREEFDTVVESLELMNDKEFKDSYAKAKEQVKRREFDDCLQSTDD